jgi:type I restriction enzyme S subunit
MTAPWPQLPIGEVCRLINGRPFKPSDWGTAGLRIVRIQNLNDPDKPFNCYDGRVDSKHLIDSGDVLLSWSGTPGTSFGCFIWDRGPGILNQHIFKVAVDETKLLKEFFVHAVNERLDEMIGLAHGGVGLRHITKDKLEAIRVGVPALVLQRRIVEAIRELMDRVDEIRSLSAEVRREAGALFLSGLSSVFRDDWRTARIVDVAVDIRNGWSGTEVGSVAPVRVLRLSAVHGLTIDPTESREVRVRPADSAAFRVRRGDVFVVRGNGSKHLVGRSAIAAEDLGGVIFNDLLIRVSPSPARLLPEFLNYSLHTARVRRQIEESAKTAAGIWKINQTALGSVRIPCPSIDTQIQAVEAARRLHERCRSLAGEVDNRAAERLPAAVLRKAFAGEL